MGSPAASRMVSSVYGAVEPITQLAVGERVAEKGGLVVTLAVAVSLSSAGCVVEAFGAAPVGVVVSSPPPPPMVEVRPAPPAAPAVWVAGYWHWTGMQYTWIPGHYGQPSPGKEWRAPRYTLHDGVYIYEPGGWWTPPPR